MLYTIDKFKNTVLLLSLLFVNICLGFIICFSLFSYSMKWVALICTQIFFFFQEGRIITDYSTWIKVDDRGVVAFRRGKQRTVSWNEVKRLEYKGVRHFPIFDILIVHTSDEPIYLEYTFSNYRGIWKAFKEYVDKYAPHTIVDKDIPD